MPWQGPPPDVRRRVNLALGYDIYPQLEGAFYRALQADPAATLNYWFRRPGEGSLAERSQHPLGLAVDVKPSRPDLRPALVDAVIREGFYVPEQYRSGSGHIHVQALDPQRFQRLLPGFEALGLWDR